MSSEEQACASDIEKEYTIGPSHPGLNVFLPNNALRYFNAESICKEELGGEEMLDFWLENGLFYEIAKRIFQKRYPSKISKQDSNGVIQVFPIKKLSSLMKSWFTIPGVTPDESSITSTKTPDEHFRKIHHCLSQMDISYASYSDPVELIKEFEEHLDDYKHVPHMKKLFKDLSMMRANLKRYEENHPELEHSCRFSHRVNERTPKKTSSLCSTSSPETHIESRDKRCAETASSSQNTPGREQNERSVEGNKQNSDEHKEINQHPPQDLTAMFYLMSILPLPHTFFFKRFMDQDGYAWKISLYDVILVFLNWGATLESLDIDEGLKASFTELFPPQMPAVSDEEISRTHLARPNRPFPHGSSVMMVLVAITERLPEMPRSARAMLVKLLVYGALDDRHRINASVYSKALCLVLDSYPSWDQNEAVTIVRQLRLDHMGLQNAEYVCSSLFLSNADTREGVLGLVACHNVLRHEFKLPFKLSLAAVVDKLIMPPALLNRFTLKQIFVLAELLHSILLRHSLIPPRAHTRETIYKLHNWSQEVRNCLNKHQYTFDLESAHVRERLSRLSLECSSVMRMFFFTSISQSVNFNNSQENSPCK